ncbi:MAG: hypothetical protein D6744_08385, partial [Planctomycetota bacterium]
MQEHVDHPHSATNALRELYVVDQVGQIIEQRRRAARLAHYDRHTALREFIQPPQRRFTIAPRITQKP